MNATNNNNNKSRVKKITYKGSILDPGGRTGTNRRNWVKRQKARIRSGTSTGSVQRRGPGTNTQSASRSQNRSYTNQQSFAGGNSQSVRNTSESGSISDKIGVAHLGAYVGAVLDPFNAPKGARVPSEVPFPSGTVTMHFTGLITPNTAGNFAAMLFPQAGTPGAGNSFVNVLFNNSFWDANNWLQTTGTPTNTGLRTAHLPAGVALKIRTVGAALKCWYVGKDVDRSGYYVSAFLPKAPVRDATTQHVLQGYSEDQLREAQYSVSCSNKATAEVLYVPRDDVDYDYMDIGVIRESSHGVIQGFGFPNTACIKWEAVIHAEYIQDPTAANSRLIDTAMSFASKEQAAAIIGSLVSTNPSYVASPDNGKNLFSDFRSGVSSFLDQSIEHVGGVARGYLSDIAADVSSELFSTLSDLAFSALL